MKGEAGRARTRAEAFDAGKRLCAQLHKPCSFVCRPNGEGPCRPSERGCFGRRRFWNGSCVFSARERDFAECKES
jgi:hypothetical protein